MPPFLDPSQCKVDGTAFLGVSLRRQSEQGHPDTVTHQVTLDLNELLDRNNDYILSSDEEGWLVGGGEPGPPISYKLPATDSAHIELMHIGTFRPEWGGVTQEEIVSVLQSGQILIPEIDVLPTMVITTQHEHPPDLEIRFDVESPQSVQDFLRNPTTSPLPVNWALRFVHNQLFQYFRFPSRYCPDAFHATMLRKVEFRSHKHQAQYLAKCDKVVKRWREQGPQPLNTGGWDVDGKPLPDPVPEYRSGIWLFLNRHQMTHCFPPNFVPPYDTPEKRMIIFDILQEEWDESYLCWKPALQSREIVTHSDSQQHLDQLPVEAYGCDIGMCASWA